MFSPSASRLVPALIVACAAAMAVAKGEVEFPHTAQPQIAATADGPLQRPR
ncbi:MAG: hypothetical protein Q8N18_13980 [Opitutaceae bacterium]|nr:hypothetical protein [Opitutaceae bacterium]